LVGDSISRLVGAAVRKDEGVVLGEGTTARRAVGYPITTHAKAAHNTKARELSPCHMPHTARIHQPEEENTIE